MMMWLHGRCRAPQASDKTTGFMPSCRRYRRGQQAPEQAGFRTAMRTAATRSRIHCCVNACGCRSSVVGRAAQLTATGRPRSSRASCPRCDDGRDGGTAVRRSRCCPGQFALEPQAGFAGRTRESSPWDRLPGRRLCGAICCLRLDRVQPTRGMRVSRSPGPLSRFSPSSGSAAVRCRAIRSIRSQVRTRHG